MHTDAKAFIKAISRVALETNSYKIVLGITGWKDALEVLNWIDGDTGSADCVRWDIAGIEAIAKLDPLFAALSDAKKKAEIIRLGVVSGLPLFFHEMMRTGPNESRANFIRAQHDEGIEKMKGYFRSRGFSSA